MQKSFSLDNFEVIVKSLGMYYSQITALFKCLRTTNLHFISVVSFQQEPLRAPNRWAVRPDPKFCFHFQMK